MPLEMRRCGDLLAREPVERLGDHDIKPHSGRRPDFRKRLVPPLGQSLDARLRDGAGDDRLDLACVAAHGTFSLNGQTGGYCYDQGGKPATAFLFNLISRLQFSGTVPMIDVQAYGRWLG